MPTSLDNIAYEFYTIVTKRRKYIGLNRNCKGDLDYKNIINYVKKHKI